MRKLGLRWEKKKERREEEEEGRKEEEEKKKSKYGISLDLRYGNLFRFVYGLHVWNDKELFRFHVWN